MENIRNTVCNNFNRLVDSSNLSKREIAKLIKVDESTLQRWGNGKSFPELPNIEKLAKALNVSEWEFYRTPQEVEKPISVSNVVPLLLSIPDHIYLKAQKIGPRHMAWEAIDGILNGAIKSLEAKSKSDKQG